MNMTQRIPTKHFRLTKSNLLRLCSLLLLLCSLSINAQQQWYFSVDERYPAQRKHLENHYRILVVNNALVQPQDFGHTTMVDGQNTGNASIDLTSSILHCLFAATQTLEASGLFNSVELMDISQNTSTNYYERNPLSFSQAEQLCADYQADALLTLNQLVLYDALESFLTGDGMYYAYMQAYAQSHWTIHYAGQSQEHSFNQADTLLWESQLHYNRSYSLQSLPARDDALLHLARELGNRVGSSFIPSWQTTRRYIYDMEDLQPGLGAFRLQRWAEAISLWQPCLVAKDKKTAACAAANMAIAYEMLGDYASASDHARSSIRLFGALRTAYARQQQVNIRYYLEHLQERQAKEGGL